MKYRTFRHGTCVLSHTITLGDEGFMRQAGNLDTDMDMTEKERTQVINLLHAEQCSCVIQNNGQLRIFRERGVKDLYRLLKEEPELLEGAFIADKIIGKAAAALMIVGGVDQVFTDTISTPALDLFRQARVEVGYTLEVPHIINRTQTGWCPLELRCRELQNPEECLVQIEDFINSIGK